MKLQDKDIKEIAEMLDAGMICYINKETHEIKSLLDLDDMYADPEEWEEEYAEINENIDAYFKIEKMSSRESFQIMEAFIDEVQDPRTRNRLIDALNRKSPFRNFKNTVDYNEGIRQQWFEFKERKYEEWVREYIRRNSETGDYPPLEATEISGFFDDDGNQLNPNLHPLPSLCLSCQKKDDPNEEILCTLTRLDQIGEEFKCFSYKSIND